MVVVHPAAHWLFHLANCFLLVSYATTNILALRILLASGSVCFTLWGALVLSISIDTTVYNGIFFIINTVQALIILYNMRSIKFDPYRELVYNHFFGKDKIKLSRTEFNKLTNPNICFIRTLNTGSFVAEKGNICNQLTLLLEGELSVSRKSGNNSNDSENFYEVHTIKPLEFADSPEWQFKHGTIGPAFDVYITCLNNCKFMVWPYEPLMNLVSKEKQLGNILNAVLGRDIVQKLFSSQICVYRNCLQFQQDQDQYHRPPFQNPESYEIIPVVDYDAVATVAVDEDNSSV
ncbi:unnamed protein product [Didymodactylos carnosus]|uniref:POPDC1-3 domain-containing protein n=1 Tax=Didymodactylos carnosus TaxID=1234261 RepID=A0A815YA32_9BILA|nr:unnamed protein product [Didymodactylos carnosus]CAF1568847.1 unnamed protein product [Didymodactylos carnosus]CAF4332862.1 unnamed protein product [Didymodactylos carnosus]CAF4431539.1 unnamed protein product [Didymodactylos carnosus]